MSELSEDDIDADRPRLQVRVTQRDVKRDDRFSLAFLRRTAVTAARVAGCRGGAEISLRLTGDRVMQELNRDYRGLNKPTDVLAFALEEGAPPLPAGCPRILGDVVISVETAEKQARDNGIDIQREIAWLVSHGVLHLLGFEHQTEDQSREMRQLEARVLDQLEGAGILA